MKVHIFQSEKKFELYGHTVDPSGSNLPHEKGPWEDTLSSQDLDTVLATTSHDIAEQLRRDGYALVQGSSLKGLQQ